MGVSWDQVLGFRGNEKEIMALHVRRTHQEGTLRQEWPVVDSNWRHVGAEEIPCEQVREPCFLGSAVLGKQIRSQRKGMGVERERERERVGCSGGGQESKVSAGSAPDVSHSTKMLGKMPLTKKAHERSLTSKNKV
jgi:hypothetical protein